MASVEGGGRCVLVAEDEPLIRLCLAGELRQAGVTTLEAASGEEAVKILGSHPISVVISDVDLGGRIDGLAVAREARRIDPNIKVILVSGKPFPNTDGLVDAFFPKPYAFERIVALVAGLVTRNDPSASAIETA